MSKNKKSKKRHGADSDFQAKIHEIRQRILASSEPNESPSAVFVFDASALDDWDTQDKEREAQVMRDLCRKNHRQLKAQEEESEEEDEKSFCWG